MRNIEVYDLEVFPNFFSYTGMNVDTKEIKQFYISEKEDQSTELIKHLGTLDGQIGFNNLNYDYPIIHYITKYSGDWIILNEKQITEKIHNCSNKIIESEYSQIPYWNIKIPQLDLFRIWHFDNKARMTSLKAIEIAINFHNVQDMPFEQDHILLEREIQSVLDYNLNDVKATYEFYKITKGDTELPLYKGKDRIQLRKDIQEKYNIHCRNYNDVKIGDAVNKMVYINITGKSARLLKDIRTFRPRIDLKDCVPKYIDFKSTYLQEFFRELKEKSITKTKGELEKELIYGETKYKFAQGGLHSEDKPRHLESTEEYQLIDCDVASMYPATIINQQLYPAHLGIEWLEGYKDVFNIRLKAKKEGKKSINEALKLALNGGGFGKTNESYNWQYDPLVTLSTTITGQLSLLMLIESLEDGGIQVLSANTDGIVSKVHKDKTDLYYSLCERWELLTKYKLEYTFYKQLIQTSVNDYLAETTNGKLKFKGDFEIDKELHKDPSMKIRAIALKEYFINKQPVEETIKKHQNIFNFCKRFRTSKGWITYKYSTDGVQMIKERQQKNIRYYISINGDKITKEKTKDGKKIDIEASTGVTIFNKYIQKDMKDYNIDYGYYVSEARKIILSIDDGQLKLF